MRHGVVSLWLTRCLWGCEADPHDDSGTADLNLLIVPVFGAADALTWEARRLAAGDGLADIGVRAIKSGFSVRSLTVGSLGTTAPPVQTGRSPGASGAPG